MNQRSIKRIKKAERKQQKRKSGVAPDIDPNRWSTAVRSWVVELQERDRSESLPAFDSLFKDASSPSTPGAKSDSS
jgi:hypothetical protein